MRKILKIFFFVLLLIPMTASAELEIHFIDVGQGDAILIRCDEETMLIDGGPSNQSETVYNYLRNHNVQRLECVLATHPHEDHIGGISAALNAVPVDLLLTPVLSYSNSKPFDSMMKYADRQGTVVSVPQTGDTIALGEAKITVLHTWPEAWTENDMSVVVYLQYRSFSAILTGDAESMSEYMILDAWPGLQATLLKVGHHGSQTSTTDEFVRTVRPKYAVISCGRQNEYGHPHQQVLNTLKKYEAEVYRTDLQGTIVFQVNENSEITIATERSIKEENKVYLSPEGPVSRSITTEAGELHYVINERTRKFHLDTCPSAGKISKKNRKEYTCTREELIMNGYTPCGECKP